MNLPDSKTKWLSLSLAALVAASTAAVWAEAPAGTQQKAAAAEQGEQPAAEQDTAENSLTIEQAVELALKNNADLNMLRLDVDNADLNARLVNAKVKDIPEDLVTSLDVAQQKYVNNAKAKMAKEVNALFLKATENQIRLGTQKAYYDLLHAQDDLALKEQSLNRYKTQLKVAQAAFEVGTRAKSDVLQAEAGVASAEAALAVAKSSVEVAKMKLNQFIGVDLSMDWTLATRPGAVEEQRIDLDEAIRQAQQKRAEVIQKQEEIKVAELNVDLIDKYLALGTYQGRMAKKEVEKARLELEKTRKEIAVEVSQAYYNLEAARTAIAAYEKAKEAAQENYRLTSLRFENGLATTLEVIQAEEELSNRENQYQEALHNYNLARVTFENALGQ
ncbi:MAG: TolC family protein [Brevibacillus sp.]|nr:TolC family protein [Brevibacillus sp.]